MKKVFTVAGIALLLTGMISACRKDASTGPNPAPASLDRVNTFIQSKATVSRVSGVIDQHVIDSLNNLGPGTPCNVTLPANYINATSVMLIRGNQAYYLIHFGSDPVFRNYHVQIPDGQYKMLVTHVENNSFYYNVSDLTITQSGPNEVTVSNLTQANWDQFNNVLQTLF